MKYAKYFLILIVSFVFTSCYHAQITTDKQPASKVIDVPWAHSFVYGIVPPSTVETAEKCPNGVARVETQISFLNGVVRGLTGGLYTPMHITVTCAAGGDMSRLKLDREHSVSITQNSAKASLAETIKKAADKSSKLQKPVYVKLE